MFITLALVIALARPLLAPAGEVNAVTIPSKTYPGGRHAWVYVPSGYPAICGSSGCNLVVAFDGAMYLGSLPVALDSLIETKRTPPTVAVLFDNGAPPGRLQDLANSKKFADFIATELVPWTRAHYAVSQDPKRAMLAGASAGGLGAAYVAFRHPELFGNVLSQSGAFWRGNEGSNDPPFEWLTTEIGFAPKVDVRFFLDVGENESQGALGGSAPSLRTANQRLRDVLERKGYRVDFYVVPNGVHSPESWWPRLPVGITTLAPLSP